MRRRCQREKHVFLRRDVGHKEKLVFLSPLSRLCLLHSWRDNEALFEAGLLVPESPHRTRMYLGKTGVRGANEVQM